LRRADEFGARGRSYQLEPGLVRSADGRPTLTNYAEESMVLVTGATGLNGSAVIRELARKREPVRALIRSPAKARALALDALPTVDLVEGDMLRPETLGAALDGVDRVLMISGPGPQMMDAQCAFIDAAKQAGVRHIINLSGLNATPDTSFISTRMHGEIERYLERSGLAWTHLRPSGFMQYHVRDVPNILAKDAIFLPMADAKQAIVDVEDIARVAFSLLRDGGHEGRSYDMTGPEALTMAEVAERISQAIGRTIRYVNVAPEERSQRLWWGHQGSPAFADAMDELFRERREGIESRVDVSTHEAFGIRPTTFAEFAQRNAAVIRGEVGIPANLSAIR
jgi:uncharacterized protein YbjT (DUF2867 family)